MYETILTEVRGSTLVITFNRPDARNAISTVMGQEITDAMNSFEADPNLRACVLTNTGNCFCAGSDLKEISAGTHKRPTDEAGNDLGFAGITKRYINKPLIAAVNGKALGGGLEIVFACDLAVASTDAIFGFPEPRVGLTAAGGGSLLRAGQMIPTKFANQLLLVAEPIDAQTAQSWGIINDVVPNEKVVDRAIELAEKIALGAPLAIQYSKRTVYETMGETPVWPSKGWDILERYEQITYTSEDAHEGSTAFAEKRKPHWTGR